MANQRRWVVLTIALFMGFTASALSDEIDTRIPVSTFGDCDSLCWLESNCCPSKFRWKFDVPAWIPEMHGSTTVRGVSAPVDITTREVFESIDDLNFVIGGKLEVKHERWGLFADGLYYNLGVDQQVLPRIDLTAGFAQAIVDFAVTYDIGELLGLPTDDDRWEADLIIGGRYNLLDVDEITLTGPLGNSITTSGQRDWVDPILGGKFRAPLTPAIDLSFRADVGGFAVGSASQFSWNIEALGEYRLSPHCRLMAGYRLLDIDQQQGSGNGLFIYDVQLRGPIARIAFQF